MNASSMRTTTTPAMARSGTCPASPGSAIGAPTRPGTTTMRMQGGTRADVESQIVGEPSGLRRGADSRNTPALATCGRVGYPARAVPPRHDGRSTAMGDHAHINRRHFLTSTLATSAVLAAPAWAQAPATVRSVEQITVLQLDEVASLDPLADFTNPGLQMHAHILEPLIDFT